MTEKARLPGGPFAFPEPGPTPSVDASMIARTVFATSLATILTAAAVPASDGRSAAIAACEDAMLAEMQARHPGAHDIQALEDVVATERTPGGQTEVAGGGQYAPTVGEWTSFTYVCDYSPTTGTVTRLKLP